MVYEKVNEFVITAGISRSTLYRFYKKNQEFWQETKLKNSKRLVPSTHAKYFDSEALFDELKTAQLENKSLRNLITCLADKDTLPRTFWDMDWSFFIMVAYQAERNKKSCFRLMHQLNEELTEKYGDDTKIRMFFTTEPFTNRKGYHNHFTLYIENKKLEPQACNDIKKFFEYDRIDITAYDMFKAGLFYMAKEGLQGDDWDILKN
ncbi:hypothetical protein [Flavobacterium microcysteis]|uniref:Uncharacterized protein n=1 Tax=Flavobacterium microcysteis TaxID=2596891 RepID=A0A501QMH2_9FLAO|nr:hypothetical protein [Flavobacterium microcysteis]TPD73664.1 hypothetical protein FJA49_00285 [Flavobacterium microcysteis]